MEMPRDSAEQRIALLQAELNELRNSGGASQSDLDIIQAWIESGKALLIFTDDVDAHAEIDRWTEALENAKRK